MRWDNFSRYPETKKGKEHGKRNADEEEFCSGQVITKRLLQRERNGQ
jgi:hypothetical protein